MLIPGVKIWLPRRYTASSPSVNRSRLRRSGTRKMFANASKNFMVPFDPALLAGSANHLRFAAGLLDLLQRRFGKLVSFHRDAAGQLSRAQHLQAFSRLLDHTRRHQAVQSERVAFELLQPSQVDDGK